MEMIWRKQSEWRFPYICPTCRVVRKLRWSPEVERPRCGCGRELYCAGNAFAAPRRSNATQWRKLAILFENGFRGFWRNHGEHFLERRMRTISEAKSWVRQRRARRARPKPLRPPRAR